MITLDIEFVAAMNIMEDGSSIIDDGDDESITDISDATYITINNFIEWHLCSRLLRIVFCIDTNRCAYLMVILTTMTVTMETLIPCDPL